jgi:hypothetical protein
MRRRSAWLGQSKGQYDVGPPAVHEGDGDARMADDALQDHDGIAGNVAVFEGTEGEAE